jgi:hypothetical protein
MVTKANLPLQSAESKEISALITAPNIASARVLVRGTSPLVIERFSKKSELMMKMAEGPTAKKAARTARDYEKEVEDARYRHPEGWEGFNASSIRAACIRACSLVNVKMTIAKLTIFVGEDGWHEEDQLPLVRIYGTSRTHTGHTRNATGVVDIRARPMYEKWFSELKIKWDADQFKGDTVFNLLSRAGMQVGIGAGRPNSKDSAGCGWGTFELVPSDETEKYQKLIQAENKRLGLNR